MNDCEKYTELMSQLLDGELSAEQESELRTHIASCESCRKVFDAFTSVSEALSDELVEPPEMLTKGVLFKIKNQKKHRRFAYGKFTALAACLALILLGAAKFGFFDNSGSVMLGSSAESATYGSAKSADDGSAAAGTDALSRQKLSREELKKGVKLEKTEDGTIYQLGFPLQNVQLLEGAKPEEVEKEPARLLNAKKIEVYKGGWYSEAELTGQSDGKTDGKTESKADSKTDSKTDNKTESKTESRTESRDDTKQLKNDQITTVTDCDTLDEIGTLLTSVPDDTTELTVDSKEFTDAAPVCTLYIPAEKSPESAQPTESESANGDRAAASSAPESKPNSFRESLESVKNSLLNKSDDDKADPSPSPDAAGDGKTEAIPVQQHDITISVYYVNGEIWCVVRRVCDRTDTDTAANAPDSGQSRTEKTAVQSAKPTETVQPSSSASPDAGSEPDADRIVKADRLLYKAAGAPEKMDALLKKLENAGNVLLTENTQKKTNG